MIVIDHIGIDEYDKMNLYIIYAYMLLLLYYTD
jgi:hypothetical protein